MLAGSNHRAIWNRCYRFSRGRVTGRSTLIQGLLHKMIAPRLQISEHTVKFHVSSIYAKLGASSRTDAVSRGVRRGFITL